VSGVTAPVARERALASRPGHRLGGPAGAGAGCRGDPGAVGRCRLSPL